MVENAEAAEFGANANTEHKRVPLSKHPLPLMLVSVFKSITLWLTVLIVANALFVSLISATAAIKGRTLLPFVGDIISALFGDGYKQYTTEGSYFANLLFPIICTILLSAFVVCAYNLTLRAASKIKGGRGAHHDFESSLKSINNKLFIGLICFVTIASICYLFIAKLPLSGDSKSVYDASMEVLTTGKFGTYFVIYPQNVGLYYVWAILYTFLGEHVITGYYILNIIVAIITYILLYKITKQLFTSEKVHTIMLLLLFFTFQPIMLVDWTYSDLLYISMTLFVAYYTIKLCRRFTMKDLIRLILFAFLDILVKQNALIVFIACGLLIFARIMQLATTKENASIAKLLVLPICAFLILPLVAGALMNFTLDSVPRNSQGQQAVPVPLSAQVLTADAPMDYKFRGETGKGVVGMWWGYATSVWERERELHNIPSDEVIIAIDSGGKEIVDNDLKELIKDYATNPRNLFVNAATKFAVFWNYPSNILLNVYLYNWNMQPDEFKQASSEIVQALHTETPVKIMDYIMGAGKMLVLFFSLLYFVLNRKKLTLMQTLLPLMLVGGSIFHLLFFLAYPKYAIPYYLMLIPYAAAGMQIFASKLKRRIPPSNQEQNV